jgi:hypothetical protein
VIYHFALLQNMVHSTAGIMLGHCCAVHTDLTATITQSSKCRAAACTCPTQDMVDNVAGMMLALLALATSSSGRSTQT